MMPKSFIIEMFLHEVLYAIDFTYNAGEELREEIIKRMDRGLYQVLKDNNLLK